MAIEKTDSLFPAQPLVKVLKEHCSYDKAKGFRTDNWDLFVKAVQDDNELGSFLIKRFVGNGSSAYVFETQDGDILKLSVGSHFPQGRPHESFDVPVKKHGKVGKVHYYVEEMLSQHDMPNYFVNLVVEKIKKAGYKADDLHETDIHQIGLSQKGELYLLDPECAKFKTIFHALWYKLRKIFK